MTPGKTLRKFRRDADLTQRALADLIGVTDSAVSEWERDQSTPGRPLAVLADEHLSAGGGVLSGFGYSTALASTDGDDLSRLDRLEAKMDTLLELLTELSRRVLAPDADVEMPLAESRTGR